MCLWLITACLGLLPASPAPSNVIVVGVPSPILQPTAGPGNQFVPPPTPPPQTNPPFMPGGSPMIPPNPTTTTEAPEATNPPPMITPGSTTNPSLTTGGESLTVLLCDNPDVVCIANPDQPVTGPQIDPRRGTTPAPSALPIIAYNAQPSSDTAVRFPRQKREARSYQTRDFRNLTEGIISSRHSIRKRQTSCTCVPNGTCSTNNGAGLIDFRIVTPGGGCPQGQQYCCTNCGGGCGGSGTIPCGTRQSVPATAVVASTGQANFGEYPWMALILTNQNDYVAGGVLIDQYNVLTVIHRLAPYIVSGTAPNIKVRLGEWDANGSYEPIPNQEYSVRRVFTHPSYNSATLQYDIAVLRLSTPVPFSPSSGSLATINRVCLPTSSGSVYTGQRCWVTGWGTNSFANGQYQNILKEVDVPIVDPNSCQSQLRAARLGNNYFLDTTSFLCAGGEANKDSCTGDGGSGLVCQSNGQWVLVGLVSWGLGCANPNVPGVYINIPALLPWIQQQVGSF